MYGTFGALCIAPLEPYYGTFGTFGTYVWYLWNLMYGPSRTLEPLFRRYKPTFGTLRIVPQEP